MHQRSGYTHRFPAGDKRNPVVVSCRIERLRKGVYHVLSLTKDAGTDHSGRQNRLAHLIAFDEAEIFQKQAGPAPVAKKLRDARVFLDQWDQQPHESDAPVVISPRSEPGVCTAWQAAGVDPGLAGEIAASAIAGKRAVVIVPPETDVVSLFADAMLLMPPDARWKTTFTTSGSGNDDYIWQAVRADLPEAEAARNLPGVIDLTTSPSAADGPYVDFARSGKGTLPWQQPAAPEESTTVAPDPGSVATDSSAPDLNVPAPDAPEYVRPVDGSMPPDLAPTGVGGAPPTNAEGRKKIKFGGDSPRQQKESKPQPNPIERNLKLGAVACAFLIVIVVVVVFSGNIIKILSATTNPSGVNQVDKGNTPLSGDKPLITEAKIKEHKQKQQEEVTKEENRVAAEQMAAEQKKEKEAEDKRKRLDAEQKAAEKEKVAAAAAADRQRQAFKQLSELPDAVSLNQGIPAGLDDQKTVSVPIGDVAIDELAGFKLALAKPKNSGLQLVESKSDGDRSWSIEAMVPDLDDGKKQKTLAKIYLKKGDGEAAERELVIEPASAGVAKLREYKLLLRSALLLFAKEPKGINKADADKGGSKPRAEKDKPQKSEQIKLQKQINLVETTRGQRDSVRYGQSQSTTNIGLGVPKFLASDSGKQTLSIDDLNIAIEVVSPCALNGQAQETTIAVTEKMKAPDHSAGDKRYRVGIFENKLIRFFLTLDAAFERNILGCRLCWDVNPKLTSDQIKKLKNQYQSVLLAKDEDNFERAKKIKIVVWKKVFDELCNYGSYPAAATASAQAFSTYMQQQLSFVDPDVLQQVLQERNEKSIDALLRVVAGHISG
ncbi:MAG: hypothetical protein ACR2NF_09750, partial [Pirellulales bacterium]